MARQKLDRKRLKDLDHDVDLEDAPDQTDAIFRAIMIVGAVVLTVAVSLMIWFEVAALFTFSFIPPAAGFAALPDVMNKLPQMIGHPRDAWPKELQPKIPPAFLFWPLVLAAAGGEIWGGLRLWNWWKRRDKRDEGRGDTHWASEKDLSTITDAKANPKINDGVILGYSEKGKLLRLEPDNHALVVAGTRSGKTAGLCVPALLTFKGVVIATSVKDDLVKHTIKQRQKMGDVYIFDPVGAMGLPEESVAGWTPLAASREWREAQRTAAALIDVALSQSNGVGNMEFFKRMSQQVMPVLLYAAAVMDEDMRLVIRWLNRINDANTHTDIDQILRWKNSRAALDAWIGFVSKDQKLRGDIAATIASALVSYEDEKVQQNALRCDITPEKLFNGGMNTLYVVAPLAEQARLEPIFVALMQSLLTWVTENPDLDTPLLAVLDEAANIAALPLLPNYLSAIGSKHAQIITSWQDFSQIKDRYGTKQNTILNNSRAKLILPGVADPETLQYFTQVTGDTIEDTVSLSKPEKGGRSVSIGEGRRALLTPAVIRQQQLGEAILVYGHLPPAKMKLRMYFKEPELLAMANGEAPAKGPAKVLPKNVVPKKLSLKR